MHEQHQVELRESVASVNRFMRRLKDRLIEQYGTGDDRVELKSDRWLQRRIALVLKHGNKGTFGPSKLRREIANQPDGMFRGCVSATRPGQVVILDTHVLNLEAYDPELDETVSLQLTAALDLATRSILAWRITVKDPAAVDATMMLADTLVPLQMRPAWKDKLRFDHMSVQTARLVTLDERLACAAALPVMYPELFLVDNGKIYVSDAMRSACQRLGASIPRARAYQATDKAHVERLFGTIQTMFAEHVAGYKGRDVSHRGPEPEASARWTVDEIREFFAEFVVTVYQRKAHAGLVNPWAPHVALSPNDAYSQALEVAGYFPTPQAPDLFYELLPLRWRQINAAGIVIEKRWYNAEIVADMRHKESPYPRGNRKQWPIRIDPRDLKYAYLKDVDGTWHTLKWTKADGMLGVCTDRMAAYARAALHGRGIHHPDEDDILGELMALQRRTDAPETWSVSDRELSRERSKAQDAARDRHNAAISVPPPEPELPSASAITGSVPRGEDDDLVLDPAELLDLGVVRGGKGQRGRPHERGYVHRTGASDRCRSVHAHAVAQVRVRRGRAVPTKATDVRPVPGAARRAADASAARAHAVPRSRSHRAHTRHAADAHRLRDDPVDERGTEAQLGGPSRFAHGRGRRSRQVDDRQDVRKEARGGPAAGLSRAIRGAGLAGRKRSTR